MRDLDSIVASGLPKSVLDTLVDRLALNHPQASAGIRFIFSTKGLKSLLETSNTTCAGNNQRRWQSTLRPNSTYSSLLLKPAILAQVGIDVTIHIDSDLRGNDNWP